MNNSTAFQTLAVSATDIDKSAATIVFLLESASPSGENRQWQPYMGAVEPVGEIRYRLITGFFAKKHNELMSAGVRQGLTLPSERAMSFELPPIQWRGG